jgi:hypothetical protein
MVATFAGGQADEGFDLPDELLSLFGERFEGGAGFQELGFQAGGGLVQAGLGGLQLVQQGGEFRLDATRPIESNEALDEWRKPSEAAGKTNIHFTVIG